MFVWHYKEGNTISICLSMLRDHPQSNTVQVSVRPSVTRLVAMIVCACLSILCECSSTKQTPTSSLLVKWNIKWSETVRERGSSDNDHGGSPGRVLSTHDHCLQLTFLLLSTVTSQVTSARIIYTGVSYQDADYTVTCDHSWPLWKKNVANAIRTVN